MIHAARRGVLRSVILATALLAAAAAQALSIGEIDLQSRLGEPLRAIVPLGNLGSLAENQILVGRASEDVYRTYGIDRASYDRPLQFELMVDAKGDATVAVTTRQPVSEPFVDMVLEVRWPSGRAVKEFTLLLDPPAR